MLLISGYILFILGLFFWLHALADEELNLPSIVLSSILIIASIEVSVYAENIHQDIERDLAKFILNHDCKDKDKIIKRHKELFFEVKKDEAVDKLKKDFKWVI